MTFAEERLAIAALAGYERWRQGRGLPPENKWREKLASQGLSLEPLETAAPFEQGDAYEAPVPPQGETTR